MVRQVKEAGFRPFINPGVERKVIAVLGEVTISKYELVDVFANMAGVERVDLISDPFKLSSRQYHPENLVVRVGDVNIGGTLISRLLKSNGNGTFTATTGVPSTGPKLVQLVE